MLLFSLLNKLRSRKPKPFIPERIPEEEIIERNEYAEVDKKKGLGRMNSTMINEKRQVKMTRLDVRSSRRYSLRRQRRMERTTDLSLIYRLLPSSSSLTLHGRITNDVLSSLSSSLSSTQGLVFDDATLAISPSFFSTIIYQLRVHSLSFLSCRFPDAHLLSDDFFQSNTQLTSITIASDKTTSMSFPLITDKSIELWTSLSSLPSIQLNSLRTSITVKGLVHLIKSAISRDSLTQRISCSLGQITSSMDDLLNTLSSIHGLRLHRVHSSFIYILSHHPRLDINCHTSPPSISLNSSDFLPVPSETRSVMLTKVGPLSRSRRTSTKRRNQKTLRQRYVSIPVDV